ncbi:MAG: hypothetical protein JNK07_12580 [Alphaproteobacteria bacterium]|nr:hypothetical protein [Alphaproteobacteria bacterium]
MRWGGNSRSRSLSRLQVPTALAAGLGVALATLSTQAWGDILRFTPTLFLEQIFTDNIRGSSTDQDADGVTSLGARLDATLDGTRVEAAMSASVYYNEFWATDEFDNFNGEGIAAGRVTLLHNRLFLDGQVSRQEVFLSPDSTSASNLSPGGSRSKETNYSVGPLLTLNVFDIADLVARATYSQILFSEPVTGPLLVPIEDLTAKQAAGRVTTGDRSSLYEAIGTAEYLETDADFRLRNIVGHLIVHLTDRIDVIGRYGYERIEDPSFPTIKGQRWSFGGRYSFADNSAIRVEYGNRFNDTSWLGEVSVQLTSRVNIAGQYTDSIAPAQLSLVRPLDDLFDDAGSVDLGTTPTQLVPNPALIGQVVRDKNFNFSADYRIGLATYSLIGRHADRQIPGLGLSDKIYSVDLEWKETLSRSLTATASVGFFDNYSPNLGSQEVQQYRAQAGFTYLFTPQVTFTGSYLWGLNVRENNDDSQENVVRLGIARSF